MRNKGFTLIEILIVLIIIGILATLAIPQFQSMAEKARKAEALTNLSAIYTAQQVYRLENGNYADVVADGATITFVMGNLGITIQQRYFKYGTSSAAPGLATATRLTEAEGTATAGLQGDVTYGGATIERNLDTGQVKASDLVYGYAPVDTWQ